MTAVRTERDLARATAERASRELQPEHRLTKEKILDFTETMRACVVNGEVPFRRAYIRSIVDRIDVAESEIRIVGRKTSIQQLALAGAPAPAAVPSFVPSWRPQRDSNPCCQRERLVS